MAVICGDCHRPLTGKKSMERGKGPVCWSKSHSPKKKAASAQVDAYDPEQCCLPFTEPVFKEECMRNLSMQEKLKKNEAVDLSGNERTGDGDYILQRFSEGTDYCDSKEEAWIWSIGRHIETGLVLASTRGKFYNNPMFHCLWVR